VLGLPEDIGIHVLSFLSLHQVLTGVYRVDKNTFHAINGPCVGMRVTSIYVF
jgi:hypothetical protein